MRQELLEVIEQRLDEIETITWAKPDMEFHFVRAQMVVFDTHGKIAEPEELERLNDDLRSKQQLLEAANEDLESFAYSVSHDLKAPVRAIEGFSRMALGRACRQTQ